MSDRPTANTRSASALNPHGKRALVMGLGRFGGGVGVARYLAERGAEVTVTDRSDEAALQSSIAQLQGLNIRYRLGGHDEADFTSADLLVVSPAVNPHRDPFVKATRDAGVPITSEVRLLVQKLPNLQHVIGVTGTAGKSTTTAMIYEGLCAAIERDGHDESPSVWMGGNIGGSLLGHIDEITAEDWVVLELSSFMLDGLDTDGFSPHIAVVTSYAPNHLDWHGTSEHYAQSKAAILRHQQAGDLAVLGPNVEAVVDAIGDDTSSAPAARYLSVAGEGRRGDIVCAAEDDLAILLPGEHNRINAALAWKVVSYVIESADLPANTKHRAIKDARQAIAGFAGLPHRMFFFLEHEDVRYFDDSKATTPDAAMLALRSFEAGKVHAILGGADKGSDLTELAALAASHAFAIYTIGATGDAIAEAASTAVIDGPVAQVIRAGNLETAVRETATRIHRGDVVLLSPGCASWDQFTNYEERGRAFEEAVIRYTGEDVPPPRERPSP